MTSRKKLHENLCPGSGVMFVLSSEMLIFSLVWLALRGLAAAQEAKFFLGLIFLLI